MDTFRTIVCELSEYLEVLLGMYCLITLIGVWNQLSEH